MRPSTSWLVCFAALGSIGPALPGCASAKIAALERFGYAKREQLVDRVEDARDGQAAARKQFESALAEFLAVTKVSGGKLEAQYERLKASYERSAGRAETVSERIDSVERVADALFKEWRSELDQYASDSMRRASERQLATTQARYKELLGAMRSAEARMAPVLAAFRDQTLFLKHNLNAQAIASLRDSATEIETDVARLVEEMNASIAEADRFIADMQSEQSG